MCIITNPGRRELQDVLTCIREKCTIHNAGYRLHQNAERYLKPMDEMKRLFRQYPEAIRQTQEIVEACRFSLDELIYVSGRDHHGRTNAAGRTDFLAWQGAHEKFGDAVP